jgi:hypothetical protein
MSSLQDRMNALAAGDVVEIPGVPPADSQSNDHSDRSRSTRPDHSADRRVSLG